MNAKRTIRQTGFTLAEILTTIAIIAILLAVLLPALNQVGKTAANVKQKAQFHSIEIALETFRGDIGDYPPSAWDVVKYGQYSASQRLAEAIVGRDGFGFHPQSEFRKDGKAKDAAGNYTVDLYSPAVDVRTNPDNIKARKGPLLELESANAVNIADYAINYGNLIQPGLPSFVLADCYKSTKLKSGRKVGMPILYYKANRFGTTHSAGSMTTNTYILDDSTGANTSGIAMFPTMHPLGSMPDWFYDRTRNPNFTDRPYRAESFILQSAGPDGFYGTADDVFNFDQDQ